MHAEIHVYTFKAGLLARMAHDLRLRVQRYELHVQAGRLRGHCDASSLLVEGVMTARGLDSAVLSERDKRQIESLSREILQSDRHPHVEVVAEVTAHAASNSFEVRGQLELRGETRPLQLELQPRGGRLEGAFELTPSEFGITPYKALGGAIKLQDRVRVHVAIDMQGQAPQVLLADAHFLQP